MLGSDNLCCFCSFFLLFLSFFFLPSYLSIARQYAQLFFIVTQQILLLSVDMDSFFFHSFFLTCFCLLLYRLCTCKKSPLSLSPFNTLLCPLCWEPLWPNGHRSCLPQGGRGSISGRIETLGRVSVNHQVTGPRCKNGTRECGEDRIMCTSPAWDVWR